MKINSFSKINNTEKRMGKTTKKKLDKNKKFSQFSKSSGHLPLVSNCGFGT
jgi:hypothetical protein